MPETIPQEDKIKLLEQFNLEIGGLCRVTTTHIIQDVVYDDAGQIEILMQGGKKVSLDKISEYPTD